jgi:hypothetical protein
LNDVLTLLLDLYKHTDIEKMSPPESVNLILSPIVSNIYRDLTINCAKDCQRFRLPVDRANQSEPIYFHRFAANLTQDFDNGEPIVLISTSTEECKLGLVPLGDFCPLSDDIPENIMDEATLEKIFSTIQKVIRKRVENITN